MRLPTKAVVLLALVLVSALFLEPTSALKRKNRVLPGKRLSLFSPFIVLDDEDRKSLGSAGEAFAKQNTITTRNPILLIPGTAPFFEMR